MMPPSESCKTIERNPSSQVMRPRIRADVRGETSRIEAANFGDSCESGVVGLPIETDAGSASEKHAKRGAVDNSPYR